MIVRQAKVAAILVDLEKRGFLVDKITLPHLPRHPAKFYLLAPGFLNYCGGLRKCQPGLIR